MDTTTIIYIVGALFVGFILAKMFSSNGKSDVEVQDAPAPSEDKSEEYKKQISDVKAKLATAEKKAKDIKGKYEGLLKEANSKVKELDEQLQAAMEGHIDESIKQKLADVEKLKKKIRQLEDENEEFEDDLDSCKKKLKSKESEFSTLQTDFDKLTREKKQLQEDLKKKSDELEEKAKALELKIQSLTFIQEILTAKKSNDASVSNLYSKIDSLCDFIGGELKDTVCGIYKNLNKDTLDNLFGNGLASWAVTAKKSWIQGKTSIAFVGEFSAGKTSIVNRILSQDNPNIPLLPVSTKATTAIPTYISGGVGTMYQFVTPNNELKNISESTFKRVNKEVLDQVQGVSSLIQYFVMTYKNSNLDRLSILDTPGFNSNDKEDAERTIGVINECDALFWVFDVNAGTVNRASINLIKQHLTKPLYVVINKVDTKPKSEVDKVEALIKKTLTDAGQTVRGFIRFSAKTPLADIMTPIKSITHDSQKEEYLDTILGALKQWASEQEKDVVNAKRNADSLLSKCNNITDHYNRAISNMGDDCYEAASIPQYNPQHGFLNMKDPNYDMSISEYQRMYGLLEKISNSHLESLCNLYNYMKETAEKMGTAYDACAKEREQWQRLNNCLDILNNKIKELKKK